jgi:hypothetical protein
MISLSAAPEEIAAIFNKFFEDLQIGDIRLDDDNHADFVLKDILFPLLPIPVLDKIKGSITDVRLRLIISCDPDAGKILFSDPQIMTYSEKSGFKKWLKENSLDPMLSVSWIKKGLLSLVPWLTDYYLEKESSGVFSFSCRNLAEQILKGNEKSPEKEDGEDPEKAKRKEERTRRLCSFLGRIRFQSVLVRDNRLVIRAMLENG